MLLITIFVELRVVAHRPLSTVVQCRGLEKYGMVRAWHGRGMASVNQTRPHCVNQMGKTHSKPLAARHVWRTAWAQQGHGILCVNRPLRSGYEAVRLLELRVRFQPEARMSVPWECCVRSGRGLCAGLISRPEESYEVWCVWVWLWILNNGEALVYWVLLRHKK
jgi:hypothetical protein